MGNGSVIGISNFTRLTTLSRFTLVHGEFLIMRPLGVKLSLITGTPQTIQIPWAIEAKKVSRGSVPQLTVSMGDQERVLERIEDNAFLNTWVVVLTPYGWRCGSSVSK